MKRYMITALLCGLTPLWCAAAFAQTTTMSTEIHMVTAPSQGNVGEDLVAAKGEALLITHAQSPRAVRLEGDSSIGKIASKRDVKAGEILFGRYDDGQWTYCAIDTPNATGQIMDAVIVGVFTGGLSLLDGPAKFIQCLHDEDNDGVFDTAWSGGNTQTENAFLAYNIHKTPLSEPVAYSKIDYADGPAMAVEILWSKNRNTGTLTFRTEIGDLKVSEKTLAVPAPGAGPETLELMGAEFEILSYDTVAETLTYRIVSGTSRQYLRLPAKLTITTTYY